jgi:hypothetical protein
VVDLNWLACWRKFQRGDEPGCGLWKVGGKKGVEGWKEATLAVKTRKQESETMLTFLCWGFMGSAKEGTPSFPGKEPVGSQTGEVLYSVCSMLLLTLLRSPRKHMWLLDYANCELAVTMKRKCNRHENYIHCV